MKILLTGAFGNVGTSTIREISNKNYSVRCFDIKNKKTEKKYNKIKNMKNLEVYWGDITDKESIRGALDGIDVIIHLAAIIPPLTDKNPVLSKKINVEGTKNIITEAEAKENIKQFIYASSVSVHGPQPPTNPLLRTDSPLIPTDTYTKHKVECEEFINKCNLNWTIIRFGAVMGYETGGDMDYEMLFGIPLEQKVEIIHTYDAGKSVVNAINNEKAIKQIFFGGAGKKGQIYTKDMLFSILKAMGIGELPEKAFKKPKSEKDWYYTHWLDTGKSQEVLQYQNLDFDEYIKEYRRQNRITRWLLTLIRPLIKRKLVKNSPYLED